MTGMKQAAEVWRNSITKEIRQTQILLSQLAYTSITVRTE